MADQYSKHLWHPMTHPNQMIGDESTHIMTGDGVYVKDDKGQRLLDCAAGIWCVNTGYNRPEINEAITNQLDELAFYPVFGGGSHPRATELAAKLVGMTELENMKRVFLTSGGSDSVESALKFARQYHILNGQPERKKFISLRKGFHGLHFGGTAVGGNPVFRQLYEPILAGTSQVDCPFTYRNPWNCEDPEQLAEHCARQLAKEIEYQGADKVAAFIAEPVLGAGGVIVPPEKYWPLIREVCDQYGVLLIADEVVTGFGRSGNMFGSRGWGVAPDMMCLAKGISGGYVPLGAVLINERMASAWDANADINGAILTGYTNTGHPLACAAALASLDIVEKENLPENARIQGRYLLDKLLPFTEKFKSVGEVRGKGLMIGIDLVQDKSTRAPIGEGSDMTKEIGRVARREGALVRTLGSEIIISPPLTFEQEHCDHLVSALNIAFTEVDK